MKTIDQQDHYEILDVARDATSEDIERAYRIAHSAYTSGSLAHYSVFDDQHASEIRDRVEIAYRVLSDRDARREYDEGIDLNTDGGDEPGHDATPNYAEEVIRSAGVASATSPGLPVAIDDFDDLDDGEESNEWGGARLRRARLRRGVELDQVAKVTKISTSYLAFIEEESLEDLPAPVYVRGFVTAYARAIGLDPRRVASSYMSLVEARGEPRRGRFLGRGQGA